MDTRGFVVLMAWDNSRFSELVEDRCLVESFNQASPAVRSTLRSREYGATTDLGIGVDAYVGLAADFGGPRFLFSGLGNSLGSMSIPGPLTRESRKFEEER